MKSGAHGQQDMATLAMQDEHYQSGAGEVETLTVQARMGPAASLYSTGDWQFSLDGAPVTREELGRDGWELRPMQARHGYADAVFARQRRG